MIVDVHVHDRGTASSSEIVKDMDEAGVDRAVIFSRYFRNVSKGKSLRMTEKQQREAIDRMGTIVSEAKDRVIGFAWIEPTLPNAADELDRAVNEKNLRGCKMIPHHWYPYDEEIFPVYEKAQELGIPILFHSGILWGFQDSSRFCRPTFYEIMLHFPKVRFALAHISWPWTDECIATYGRFRSAAAYDPKRQQMLIDTTRGTPEFYRKDAMDKALKYVGIDHLIFGSDSLAGSMKGTADDHVRKDRELLTELGVSPEDQEKYFSKNYELLFQPAAGDLDLVE